MIKLSNLRMVHAPVVLTAVFLLAFFLLLAPSTHAQSPQMQLMLTRMEAIMTQMELLQKEFLTLASGIQSENTTTPSPQVLGASASAVFTESLDEGETNNDLKRVQTLLATDPEIYPYGVSSGFFGPKTKEAIQNLQSRFNLDPVGVIGPATTALLEGYMRAYPDGNYPDGVLSSKPRVLGASTSNTPVPAVTQPVTTTSVASVNPADSIEARFDDDETWIDIEYNDGTKMQRIVADTEDEDDVVDFIVKKTKLTKAQVTALIEFDGRKSSSKSSRSEYDEDDAEDALSDADDAIDDADDEVADADEDGDDVDWAEDTLKEAEDLYDDAEDAFDDEDWDKVVELAEEVEDTAKEAEDRIDEEEKNDSDDIDEIIAYVGDGETEVVVEYDNGSDDDFKVNEEEDDDIIREIAEELDLDEDDVEDLIEFRGKKVDEIYVEFDDGEALVDISYEDGESDNYNLDTTDEDEVIEKLARKLDLTENEIERVTKFD
jgi:peptidoglycan hydrolase-like protein with peptidoglycan-binding domain